MIGLVLWSDDKDRKAVFWCEDHGDLAYYDGTRDEEAGVFNLNAGDMVRFELSNDGSVRRAHHPKLITRKACNGIQEHLRDSATGQAQAEERHARSANVVSFRARRYQGGADPQVVAG